MTTASPSKNVPGPRGPQSQGGNVSIDPIRIAKQYRVPLLLSVVLGLVLGIGAQLTLTRVMPRYDCNVVYEAQPPEASIRNADGVVVQSTREEIERFILTQVSIIGSDKILRESLKKAEIGSTQWAKNFLDREGRLIEVDAFKDLKEIVSVRPRTGTALIFLAVRTPLNTDSSAIAAAVHSAYWDDLASKKLNVTNEKREPLSASLKEIEAKILDIDKNVRVIVVREELESSGERMSSLSTLESEIGQLQPRIAEARQRQAAAIERRNAIEKLANELAFTDEQKELAERDQVVMSTKQRISEYTANRAAMLHRGLGETHPDVVRLQGLIDGMREEYTRNLSAALRKLADSDLEGARRAADGASNEIQELVKRVEELRAGKLRVAQAELELSTLRETKTRLIDERDRINRALRNLDELASLKGSNRIDRVRLLAQPVTPDEMAFPRWVMMIPAGLIISIGLTLSVIVLRELLDTRIKSPADVNMIARARLLGVIPRADEDPTRPANPETAFRDSPTGAISESFRQLRGTLFKKMRASGQKSLLVVPASPGSGATTVVANLAMGAAASDLKVLVIDGNLRRPTLHKVFKLADGPGLADVLAKKCDLSMALQATSLPNLTLLSAGSATLRSVPERLSAEVLTATLEEARGKFDFVIIDSAPALVAGDAQALANRTDASLLVVKAFGEKRGQVGRLRDQLAEGHAEVLGIVVNQVRSATGGYMKKNIQMAYDYQTNPAA